MVYIIARRGRSEILQSPSSLRPVSNSATTERVCAAGALHLASFRPPRAYKPTSLLSNGTVEGPALRLPGTGWKVGYEFIRNQSASGDLPTVRIRPDLALLQHPDGERSSL